MLSRKTFIRSSIIASTGLLFSSFKIKTDEARKQLTAELVKEFVGVAHRDKNRVVELLTLNPTLLNAAWDWGGGDFETALGAASHVGAIETVNYLLDNGAQMNFLTLCVLGKLDLVKAWHADYPFLINMKGPHGFTPLHHAIQGGDTALAVKEYLESKGAVESKVILSFPAE
ncbi:MAG: hypothetical protein ACHQFW_06770 [Chitinophagales bacterium]